MSGEAGFSDDSFTDGWRVRGLQSWDDFPVHQAAEVLAVPSDSDPGFTDRWYFNVQDPVDGSLLAIVGAGFYPNTGICEAYCCVLVDGTQLNLRAWEENRDKDRLQAGPLRFEILEPMRTWRTEVDHGSITMDFEFRGGDTLYHYEPLWAGRDVEGGGRDFYHHLVQVGSVEGEISAHGSVVWSGTARSARDRTWGVRSRRPKLHNWYMLYFDNLLICLIHDERADGSLLFSEAALVRPDGRFNRLVPVAHDLTFDPLSRELVNGRWRLTDSGGRPVDLEFDRVAESIRGLGAGYDDKQGAPDAGSRNIVEGTWALDDPELIRRIGRGTIDTPVRAVVHVGGKELRGFGVVESALGWSHVRYGQQLERHDAASNPDV